MSNTSSKAAKLIAVCGGIGSGKSVVCAVLRAMGHKVYDCDTEARAIMDRDDAIKAEIAASISPLAIRPDGTIDRPALAAEVFASPKKLDILNKLVHGAVRADILAKAARCQEPVMFVETAILYQSGLDRLADEVWEVVAPQPVRVERVMKRNSLSREQVLSRIAAQDSFTVSSPHPRLFTIVNDGLTPILPQIENLFHRHRL